MDHLILGLLSIEQLHTKYDKRIPLSFGEIHADKL